MMGDGNRSTFGVMLAILVVATALFFSMPAVGLALVDYDGFGGTGIDNEKWSAYELVRDIQDGKARLGVRSSRLSNAPVMASLDFPTPQSVYAIETTVVFAGWNNPSGAAAMLSAGGRFYNDGSGSAGSYMGDIRADVRIGGLGTTPTASWIVSRHTGTTDPNPTEPVAAGNFSITPEVGGTYRLYIRWNGTSFTFRFNGEEKTYTPPHGTRLDANRPFKQIYARISNNSGKEAGIRGWFDDVRINDQAVLYDDFLQAAIDPAKWPTYESARHIVDGRLRIKARTGPASTAPLHNSLSVIAPATIMGMEAKITPIVLHSVSGSSVSARVQGGWFYNDGTPGGGYVGDVSAFVGIESQDGAAPAAVWYVVKGTDPANPDLSSLIMSGTFTKPIVLGNTYRAFLSWDGAKFTFRFDDEEVVYAPTTELKPPNNLPWWHLRVRIRQSMGLDVTGEAYFDDVKVEYIAADLPRTGQARCYAASGMEVPCAGTGQDGDLQTGVAWPEPRFSVTYCNDSGPCADQSADCDGNPGNDVIADALTGIMWPRYGNLTSGTLNWGDAVSYANGLSLCGLGYWRLPNINELESLVNAGVSNTTTWLLAQGFVNVQPLRYWSSTTVSGDTGQALDVNIGDGNISYNGKSLNDRYVLPCKEWNRMWAPAPVWRTGQEASYWFGDDGDERFGLVWPAPRFVESGDCVIDRLTGLMWAKNARLAGSALGWADAMAYAGSLSLCGYRDWKLPNRKELRSLADYSQSGPALPAGHPFSGVMTHYWTSTTTGSTDQAWVMNMGNGTFAAPSYSKYATYDAWPVRNTLTGPGPGTQYALTVGKSGPGSGTVNSSPPGISCGEDCSESYLPGTVVTLTPTPDANAVFAYWSGACTGETPTCIVTMNADTAVNVVFVPVKTKGVKLTVSKVAVSKGGGTVTSSDGAINCGKDCAEDFYLGAPALLTAVANPDSVFAGWTGCPSPSGTTCSLTMDKAKAVKATFIGPSLLAVGKASVNKGKGTVTSLPSGIDCGPSCTAAKAGFRKDTSVMLTASPDPTSVFAGWTGCPSPSGTTCSLTMDKAKAVKATFIGPLPLNVAITLKNKATGAVTSSPPGISCPGDCAELYLYNTTVTLNAAAGPGSTFTGWTGCDSVATNTCTVSMTKAKSVKATFDKPKTTAGAE